MHHAFQSFNLFIVTCDDSLIVVLSDMKHYLFDCLFFRLFFFFLFLVVLFVIHAIDYIMILVIGVCHFHL